MKGGRSFHLSPRARTDIRDIHRYVSEENPEAADRLIDLISAKIEWIAESGFNDVARDWLHPGLRAAALRNYSIYFIATVTLVTVIRVLHGARNINAEMFSDSNS